jgi:hypothetical protein
MFWLAIGIAVGIYLDQTFTIPSLSEYMKMLQEKIRKSRHLANKHE